MVDACYDHWCTFLELHVVITIFSAQGLERCFSIRAISWTYRAVVLQEAEKKPDFETVGHFCFASSLSKWLVHYASRRGGMGLKSKGLKTVRSRRCGGLVAFLFFATRFACGGVGLLEIQLYWIYCSLSTNLWRCVQRVSNCYRLFFMLYWGGCVLLKNLLRSYFAEFY